MSGFRSALLAFLSLSLLCLNTAYSQSRFKLRIKTSSEFEQLIRKYKYNENPIDSLSAVQTINELVSSLHSDGFLLASIDDIFKEGELIEALIIPGAQFKWLSLSSGNVEKNLLRRADYKKSRFDGRRFSYKEIGRIENRLLSYAEENGYPFASLKYDSLSIVDNQFSAAFNLDLGPSITFDSVYIKGEKVLKSKFASTYLGLNMGQPYNQKVIDGVVQKLRKLPYLRLSKSPQLSFQNREARVTLELTKRPINTIDGIIGFLPNTSRNNGLLITGQFDLELYNPFATGKRIGLHWRRLSEETQSLKMEYDHPNIFRSPLSVETEFLFLKQDTTFTRRDFKVDLNFNIGLNSILSFFTDFRNTDLLATSRYKNASQLPDIVDFSLTRYGLTMELDYLDDIFLPRKGFRLELSASVGNKVIRQNADLPGELYQGVDLRTLQYQYDLQLDHYFSFNPKFVLYSAVTGGILSNSRLFRNDAYRLGGLNSIRGFSENFFFATTYAYSTIEPRIFFDETSYLSVFTDLGVLKGDFVDVTEGDYEIALGLGAGIHFSTGNGIFNFVYALGTSDNSGSLNFNQSKIHFGYTTRF